MRQRPLGGDNGYIKREIWVIENLTLAGGRHVLCSLDIMEAGYQSKAQKKEIKSDEKKFSMIHLVQTPDPVRYGNLNKELQHGSYVKKGGKYNYLWRRL